MSMMLVFGKWLFARCEFHAGLVISPIQKLGRRPSVVFDNHIRETFCVLSAPWHSFG